MQRVAVIAVVAAVALVGCAPVPAPPPTAEQAATTVPSTSPTTSTTTLVEARPAVALAVDFDAAPWEPPPTLSPGASGDVVAGVQERLIGFGYELPGVDGRYSGLTVVAVQRFQEVQGLRPDGIVGLATWTALAFPAEPFEVLPLITEMPQAADLLAPAQPTPAAAPPGGTGVIPAGGFGLAVVRLGAQQVDLYGADGTLAFTFPVSSGRGGLTPPGTFAVQRKSASTVSTVDHEVAMRWMTNFHGGIGFHGIPTKHGRALHTPLGQQPVSAGCVRMSDEAAQILFDHLPVGATVRVEP